jgi:hypothetical protein
MYGGRARPPYSLLDSPREQLWEVCSINRLLVKLTITAAAGGLLFSNPTVAQILPPQKRAEHVEITKAPELEAAVDDMVIVRWTTINPRGDDEHYGVVHYGTDPEDLSQTRKVTSGSTENIQRRLFGFAWWI